MMDLNTLQFLRNYIKKRIEETRQDICYGIDTLDRLHYAKGRLSALETLLQDLKDLQKKEENVDDDNNT
jgi:hypothetical protein